MDLFYQFRIVTIETDLLYTAVRPGQRYSVSVAANLRQGRFAPEPPDPCKSCALNPPVLPCIHSTFPECKQVFAFLFCTSSFSKQAGSTRLRCATPWQARLRCAMPWQARGHAVGCRPIGLSSLRILANHVLKIHQCYRAYAQLSPNANRSLHFPSALLHFQNFCPAFCF